MTDDEMRQLDNWIAEHVMEWTVKYGDVEQQLCYDRNGKFVYLNFRPTIDAGSAMEVLKKLNTRLDCEDVAFGYCPGMEWSGGNWYLYSIFRENRSEIGQWRVNGETLELAICLFAKKLFSTVKQCARTK